MNWISGNQFTAETEGYNTGLAERATVELPKLPTQQKDALEAAFTSAKAEAAKQKSTEFSSSQGVLKRARAAEIAKILISDQGTLPENVRDLAAQIKVKLPQSTSKAADKQLRAILDKLVSDPELREVLESIGAPSSKENPANELIRNTLGLGPEDAIIPAHARRAALACLLSDPRQGRVGSCFTTSLAIHLQANSPELMLQDLKDLVESGSFTRGEVTYNLANQYTNDGLNSELLVDPDYSGGAAMTGPGGGAVYGDKLHTIPALAACFKELGITEAREQKAMIKQALKDLRVLHPPEKRSIWDKLTFSNRTSRVKMSDLVNQIALQSFGLPSNTLKLRKQLSALSGEIQLLNEAEYPDDALINEKVDEYDAIQNQLLANKEGLRNYESRIARFEGLFIQNTATNPLLQAWTYTIGNASESDDTPERGFTQHLMGTQETPDGRRTRGIDRMLLELLEEQFPGDDQAIESFYKDFGGKMEALLKERLGFKYVGGHYVVVDKTGATEPKFGTERTPGEAIQEAVSGLLLEAYTQVVGNRDYSKEKEVCRFKIERFKREKAELEGTEHSDGEDLEKINRAITKQQGILERIEQGLQQRGEQRNVVEALRHHIRSPEFLAHWAQGYLPTKGESLTIEDLSNTAAMNAKIEDSMDGGAGRAVLRAYFKKPNDNVPGIQFRASEAKGLAANLIINALAMKASASTTVGGTSDDANQRIFVTAGNHVFNLLPNQGLFKKAIDAIKAQNLPRAEQKAAAEAWLAENIPPETLIIADTNWEDNGQHIQFGICADKKGNLKLVKLDENGKDLGGITVSGKKTKALNQEEWLGQWVLYTIKTTDVEAAKGR